MKTLTFIITLLLLCISPAFSQSQTVESFSLLAISDSIKLLVSSVNWLFVIVFMLVTWLLNDTSEATNTLTVTWFTKIPKAVRALILGFVCILVFAWVNQTASREEVFKLLLRLLIAMVIFKFGIDKILRFISKCLGLKFE
jgi:hypothetical protein